jgi:hypothetical protein
MTARPPGTLIILAKIADLAAACTSSRSTAAAGGKPLGRRNDGPVRRRSIIIAADRRAVGASRGTDDGSAARNSLFRNGETFQ